MAKKKNPFEKNLSELETILSLIQNHTGPINVTPELMDELEEVKTEMSLFQEVWEKFLKDNEVDVSKPIEPETPEDKRFLDRLNKIEKDANEYQDQVQQALREMKEKGVVPKEQDAKKSAKQRKKKFRGAGDGWVPL